MAMVRAALARGPFRSCLFSFSCLGHSRLSSSALETFPEVYAGKAVHTKPSGVESWAQKGRNELVGHFLKEQRRLLNEFLCHLKDRRVLLDSIGEELGLQKFDSKTRKASIDDTMSLPEDIGLCFYDFNTRKEVAMDAVSKASSIYVENSVAEQSEKNSDLELGVTSESPAPCGVPVVFPEEGSKDGGPITVKEAGTKNFQHPSWPEWTTFLNHLRPFASSEKSTGDFELSSFELFEDTTILKRAIVKFAQAHEGTFRSLSRKDLLMLVQHEFPSMDEKTAAGKKKLDDYLRADGDKVNRMWNNKVPRAKLTDVVRLVYRAVRSMPALGGTLPSDLNSAIIHIVQDLNSTSIAKHNGTVQTTENFLPANSQPAQDTNQRSAKVDDDETCGDISRTVDAEASPRERNARSAY